MNINEFLVMQAQQKAKWEADIERRKESRKAIDFYENNDDEYIKERIEKRYDSREAKVINNYLETMPVTERLINDSSLLFRVNPVIMTEDETQSEKLNQCMDDLQFNAYLREINKLTNLLYDMAVMPNVRDGKLVLDLITPDMMFVEQDPDDPTKAVKVYYSVGISQNTANGGRVDVYEFWDADGKHRCNVNYENGYISDVEDLEAPEYNGEIPIVMFRNYIPRESFFTDKRNAIVKLHENIDLRLTALNCMEDFNIPARVNIGVPSDQEFKLGFSFMTNIPANDMGQAVGDSKYINPNAPIEKEWELIEKRMTQGALSIGLSTASIKGSEFTSGYHMKLSKEEILSKNAEQRPYYEKSIKELLRLIGITDKSTVKPYGLNPDNEYFINFGEITFMESAEEIERRRAMQLSNGVKSVVDFLIEDDPDLNEDEALLKKVKIDQINNRFNATQSFKAALTQAKNEEI